jgi:large subunit ribosomal protein L25
VADVKLSASSRSEFGKGAARRLRRDGLIPAVLYGHGLDPVHVALPGHATMMALKKTNVLFEIELDGDTTLALAKDVQRNPVRSDIEHVDLLIVRRGEKVIVEVPVFVVGESVPGTIHLLEAQTLSVEAEATRLPTGLEVSIEDLDVGARILAGEVELPEGSTLVTDPEALVLVVTIPKEEVEEVEEDELLEEGEVAAEDLEGEAAEAAEEATEEASE